MIIKFFNGFLNDPVEIFETNTSNLPVLPTKEDTVYLKVQTSLMKAQNKEAKIFSAVVDHVFFNLIKNEIHIHVTLRVSYEESDFM